MQTSAWQVRTAVWREANVILAGANVSLAGANVSPLIHAIRQSSLSLDIQLNGKKDKKNQHFAEIDSIRHLGVAFDPAFSFKKHVSNICRSAFYHIRDLRRIHLNKATAIFVANALVSSRLDYCNSLLFGCSEKYKTSLQRVQNCLALVVTRSSRLSESRPLLKSLHWLPFKSRIKFKLKLPTYKARLEGTPSYFSDLLHFEKHQQTLRSECTKLLHLGPRSKRNYGYSSFVVAHCACGINCLLTIFKMVASRLP